MSELPIQAQTASELAEPAPPAPPRPLTARARRRAWTEPRIRFWWMLALALLAIGFYLLIWQYLAWRQDSRLIASGTQIPATVQSVQGITFAGKKYQGEEGPIQLRYQWQGQTYDVTVPSIPGVWLEIGKPIPIRIDPAHPELWTARFTPAPLLHQLIGAILALPIGLLLLAISFWLWARVLRTWREGDAQAALVIAARHTALAPRSWQVQCTPADQSDKRLLTVFAPPEVHPVTGATIWLLALPAGRALAASWFG